MFLKNKQKSKKKVKQIIRSYFVKILEIYRKIIKIKQFYKIFKFKNQIKKFISLFNKKIENVKSSSVNLKNQTKV